MSAFVPDCLVGGLCSGLFVPEIYTKNPCGRRVLTSPLPQFAHQVMCLFWSTSSRVKTIPNHWVV